MDKNIKNDINEMKYLFGYQRGVVISEQKEVPMEEDFDTEQLVDLHLAGGNSCSEIDTGRKNMKLVQDPEKKPNHYYVELINPAAAAADEPAAADEHVVSKSNVY